MVNTSDGLTRSFDPRLPAELRALRQLLQCRSVTGLSLQTDTSVNALPRPKAFHGQVVFTAEALEGDDGQALGERVTAYAGDVRLSLSWTYGSKLVRSELVRVGALKYSSHSREGSA